MYKHKLFVNFMFDDIEHEKEMMEQLEYLYPEYEIIPMFCNSKEVFLRLEDIHGIFIQGKQY